MITITVNGQRKFFDSKISLLELLTHLNIDTRSLAVAVNAEIIPRSRLETDLVKDGDVVEVIRAVGGG